MIDRTLLTEAAEWWKADTTPLHDGHPLIVSARLLLDFPTGQQVEAAARAFLLADEGEFPYLTDDEAWQRWWLQTSDESDGYAKPMRAALEAVRDTMIGDQ